jgi:multidrug resistance protein MdtO
LYAFEAFPKKSYESLVNRSIRTLLPELRAFLLVKTGLFQHQSVVLAESEAVLVREVEETASALLRGLADAIERESPEPLSSWSAGAEELRARISIEEAKVRDGNDLSKYTEMRLCVSLLDLASDLERRARSNFALEANAANSGGISSVGIIAEV